jgi:putative transposase
MNTTHREREYQRDEHRVHPIIYHLIWRPRRRKPMLVGLVAARCRALLEGKCTGKGWEILALAIQPDHSHLFVRVWPSDSAAEVVKECRGITAFHVRRESPPLLKLPSMWTRSSFASTAGNVSQQTIQRYPDTQTGDNRE